MLLQIKSYLKSREAKGVVAFKKLIIKSQPLQRNLAFQVDGEVRQKGSTKDMIFSVPFLISHISSIMTLFEGDVILTGIHLNKTLCKIRAFWCRELNFVRI